MIHECVEIERNMPDDPTRDFMVTHDGFSTAADISRLCGKIPKPHEDRGDKWMGWTVHDICMTPHGDKCVVVRVSYRPPQIAVAEDSDEPHFPPYNGPKGKQPDGSFILSPRMFYYLRQAWMYRGRDNMFPTSRTHFHEFCDVLHEETGWAREEYT